MSRKLLLTAAVLFLATAGPARAQLPFYLPAGSTPQGDYLRGLGVSAAGLGILEVDNAIAASINTDTTIRWNEYVSAVVEYQARKYAERTRAEIQRKTENLNAILKRIAEHPEPLDVEKGSTLNALRDQILDPSVSSSSYKYAEVKLPADTVRRIPFKVDRESLTFSMNRITATGMAKWPPAFQGEAFAPYRRAYDRAVGRVIEEQIEEKLEKADIERVGQAIDALEAKLREVFPAVKETLFMDGKRRIDDFRVCYERILKSHNVQKAVAELDQYAGTTVIDLLLFMRKHRLAFGGAETPEERKLFPELYTVLKEQQFKLEGARTAGEKPAGPNP